MLRRILALLRKELWAVWGDPRSRAVVIVPPILQLFVFSFAATLEVRNIDVAVLDQDGGRWARELVARIDGSPNFAELRRVATPEALRQAVDRGEVLIGLRLLPSFSRNVESGLRPAEAQAILDGRRLNAAQAAQGYLDAILDGIVATTPPPVVPRNLYNPNLDYIWFTVPSLMAVITMMAGLAISGLSVARERELGTFDQLLVSPLRPSEILVGKLAPAVLVGMFHGTVGILAARFVFGVPLTGSLALLYAAMLAYLLAIAGVGLFISSLAATQQQAILGVFVFAAPAMLLSGFASPIENIPDWLRWITVANPPRWFMVVARGVFLKEMDAATVAANAWPLLPIAAATLAAAAVLFRARLE
jgi:ABC-2 type transport system permease protein